mgnify:CR=1 FL=1
MNQFFSKMKKSKIHFRFKLQCIDRFCAMIAHHREELRKSDGGMIEELFKERVTV